MKKSNGPVPVARAARSHLIIKEIDSSRLEPPASNELDQAVILAQVVDESPEQLAARAAERLAWSDGHGRGFDAARYQLGPGDGPDWSRARRAVLMALLAQARTRGSLRFIAVEAPECSASQRQELMAVVEALWSLPTSTRPELRFVFGAQRPPELRRLAHAN